jgi:hypothetical protein
MTKEYIGDGVYVDIEHGMIKLTGEIPLSNGGISVVDTFYLEPIVLRTLNQYATRMGITHD